MEICKKDENCFVASKSITMQIRATRKIINVKTVMKTTILVFVLLVKIRSNLDNLSNPSSNNLANNQADALLQTAFVKVGDLYLRKISKVNVLLDTVRRRTYISDHLKNYLNLPVLQKEQILILSIWNRGHSCKKCWYCTFENY